MYTIGIILSGKRHRATIANGDTRVPAPDFDSDKAVKAAINAMPRDERLGLVCVKVDYLVKAAA